jgi:hypothetical protein
MSRRDNGTIEPWNPRTLQGYLPDAGLDDKVGDAGGTSIDIWIIVAATVATAVFMGGGLVIAYLAYQYGRTSSGDRRPIQIRPARQLSPLFDDRKHWWMPEKE